MCGARLDGKRLDVHYIDRNRMNASVKKLTALCHPYHMKTNIRTDHDEQLKKLVGVHNGTQIISVDREWYGGEVYNLEVEEDHTYALQGCVVHNCDDILSDFSNPLSSSELRQINRVFRQAIMSLPANPDDVLGIIGTPQSYDDILYQLAIDDDWLWITYPAIKNWSAHTVQWPEKFNYERLMRIRKSIQVSAFEVEYQLTPVIVTDQFLTRDEIMVVVDGQLVSWNLDSEFPNSSALARSILGIAAASPALRSIGRGRVDACG